MGGGKCYLPAKSFSVTDLYNNYLKSYFDLSIDCAIVRNFIVFTYSVYADLSILFYTLSETTGQIFYNIFYIDSEFCSTLHIKFLNLKL